MWIDGKKEQTGKLNHKSPDEAAALRGGHGEGGVESYSGSGHEALTDKNEQQKFVWGSARLRLATSSVMQRAGRNSLLKLKVHQTILGLAYPASTI
jgi:hypothetical protein